MIRQYPLPLPQREAMSAADFMVTDSNKTAWQWIAGQSPAAWAGHCLILSGAKGTGKTHLLRIWQQRVQAAAVAPGDDVLGAVIEGNRHYRALAIDDADGIAGNAGFEVWLQHLFNAAKAAAVPLLLTARLPPKDWGLGLADIKSRLCAAMTVEIAAPDDALLTSLLMKQFEDRQLRVEYGVIDYLLRHMDRSAAAAGSIVTQIDRIALEQQRKVTVPMVKQILNSEG